MPNLAFHIEVLNQVIAKRAAQSDPIAIKLNNAANTQLKQFAVLGAMGPDMLRYTPVSNKLATFLGNFIPPATSGTVMTSAQINAATAQIQTAENGRIGTDIKGVVVIEEFKPIDLTVDGQRQRSQTERKDHLAAEEPERAAGHIHYGTRVRHIRGLPEAREATNRSQDSRIRGEKFPSFSSSALDRARIASWQLALRLLENARKSALEHVAPWEAR